MSATTTDLLLSATEGIFEDGAFESVRKEEISRQTKRLKENLRTYFYKDHRGTEIFNTENTDRFGQTEDYFKEAFRLGINLLHSVKIDKNESQNIELMKEALQSRSNIIRYLIKIHRDIDLFKVALREIPAEYISYYKSEDEASFAQIASINLPSRTMPLRALPLGGWCDHGGLDDSLNIKNTILGWMDILAEFTDSYIYRSDRIPSVKNDIENLRKIIGRQNHAQFLLLFKAAKEENPSSFPNIAFRIAAKRYAIAELDNQLEVCIDATACEEEKMTEIKKVKSDLDKCKGDMLGLRSFWRHERKDFFIKLAYCLSMYTILIPAWCIIFVTTDSPKNLPLVLVASTGIVSMLLVFGVMCIYARSYKSKIIKDLELILGSTNESATDIEPNGVFGNNNGGEGNRSQINAQNRLGNFSKRYKEYLVAGFIESDDIHPDNNLQLTIKAVAGASPVAETACGLVV